ncbi:hypothetical protein LXL04_020178 [Taraxacum kok-saghyz]
MEIEEMKSGYEWSIEMRSFLKQLNVPLQCSKVLVPSEQKHMISVVFLLKPHRPRDSSHFSQSAMLSQLSSNPSLKAPMKAFPSVNVLIRENERQSSDGNVIAHPRAIRDCDSLRNVIVYEDDTLSFIDYSRDKVRIVP